MSDQLTTPTYSHAVVAMKGHEFTVDVVLDSNVHTVGTFYATDSGVSVASLPTLLMMKAATLVSRCSEKDLFDLLWLSEHVSLPSPAEWLAIGQKIDLGMTGEAVLMALASAKPRLSACGFAADQGLSDAAVFAQIMSFKTLLEGQFIDYLQHLAPPVEIAKLFRFFKRHR